MKKSILLLIIFFCVLFLCAQSENREIDTPLPNEDFFNLSELVIEGQPWKIVATYDTKGNRNREDIYYIEAITVLKVYKGDQSLQGSTIYITNKGGVLGEENVPFEPDHAHFVPNIFWENGVLCGVGNITPKIYFLVSSDSLKENTIENHKESSESQ
jgi:hypothetical protein